MNKDILFYNTTREEMNFEEVFKELVEFIQKDPANLYRLAIGTDSQVHPNGTKFISSIHLHRVGKGAWGCLKKKVLSRRITSLREKIQLEAAYSQEIASLFTPEHLANLVDLLVPFLEEGADLIFEIHLDIGKLGKTKHLIQEMTEQIVALV